jgi:hypothetical protein
MIHALVKDLFFRSKIDATAHALEKEVEFFTDVYTIKNASLVLVDLEEFGLEGVQKIVEHNPRATIIGFLSHKRVDLIQRAGMIPSLKVLPRSRFVQELEQILSD